MLPVITALVGAAVGFALGCKYKDVLSARNSSKGSYRNSIQRPEPIVYVSPQTNVPSNGFPLSSIKHIFQEYNTPLDSSNSFTLLLESIKQNSYFSLLKEIIKRVETPKDLYDFINQESFNVKNYSFSLSSSGPFISDEELDKIIMNENVSDSNILNGSKEKIEFLLTLYQAKGTKRFEESFGRNLKTFIDLYEKNEDTSALFESIMETMRKRVDYMS